VAKTLFFSLAILAYLAVQFIFLRKDSMDLPGELKVGLKEWAVVCRAMGSGRQMILLRKGGVSESIGGFEIEHREFLFYPTYVHQQRDMLKAEAQAGLVSAAVEPEHVGVSVAGQITDIVQMPSRAVMDSLDGEHIWASPLIDMRFNYRPKNPLYLLLVRAYRLGAAVTIENRPEYAGCKSWVPLDEAISTGNAVPVLDDADYARRRQGILDRIKS
jgi:hypothetical protein